MKKSILIIKLIALYYIFLGGCSLLNLCFEFYELFSEFYENSNDIIGAFLFPLSLAGWWTIYSIIAGIGLFLLRTWGWYLSILNCTVVTILMAVAFFVFGYSCNNELVFSRLVSGSIVPIIFLIVLFLPPVRNIFNIKHNKFRLKTPYGLFFIVTACVLLSPAILSFWIRHKFPRSVTPYPNQLKLESRNFSQKDLYQKVEAFGLSFVLPKDLQRHKSEAEDVSLIAFKNDDTKALCWVHKEAIFSMTGEMKDIAGFKDFYAFEKSIYTSNWAAAQLWLKASTLPSCKIFLINEFSSHQGIKGYIRIGKEVERYFYNVTLYDLENNSLGEIIYVFPKENYNVVEDSIASIKFV